MSQENVRGIDVINRRFLTEFPRDAGRAIDQLSKREAVAFLSTQDAGAIAGIWRHISPARAAELVSSLPDDTVATVLPQLEPRVCAATLRLVSEKNFDRCLELVPREVAEELTRLMTYPPDSAGRIMDSRVLTFAASQTASAALEILRKNKPRGLTQLLLVDEEQVFVAAVDIQDLAMADPDQTLSSISKPPSATTSPFESRQQVAEQMNEFSLDMLPVIDVSGQLIGVIRHSALVKTLREETSLDIQRMVGVSKDERALSSPWFAVRKRLPWMEINLVTAFLAAAVVGLFEDTIARFTALAVLLPVVAGQSGNAGAQALAVTMRGLALREITGRHWFRVMYKEVRVGVMNGIAIALTTSLGVYLWSKSWGLAMVIGVSMVIAMVAAGIAGSLIPIALTRIGQDPAQSSSIILTTVTDVAGFMSFLGIATLLASTL